MWRVGNCLIRCVMSRKVLCVDCEEKIENGATIFNPVSVDDESGQGRGHCNDSVAFIFHLQWKAVSVTGGARASLKEWRTAFSTLIRLVVTVKPGVAETGDCTWCLRRRTL